MRLHLFARFFLFVCLCALLLGLLSVSILAQSDMAYGDCGSGEEWRMPTLGAVAILVGIAVLIGVGLYFLLFLYYKRRK